MPYDPANDQFFWGYSPFEDGSNYDPSLPSPKLSDAFRVLRRHAKGSTLLQVVVTGKIKYTAGRNFDGYTGTIDLDSLEVIARGKGGTHGGGGASLEKKIQQMFSLKNEPEHVTGIYFRILN